MTVITMKRATTKVLNWAVTSDGVAVNISSQTLRFMAKASQKDADVDAIISKSTTSGITITNGPGGLLSMTLNPTDSNDTTHFPAGVTTTLYWTLRYIDGANCYDVDSGTLVFEPGAVLAVT